MVTERKPFLAVNSDSPGRFDDKRPWLEPPWGETKHSGLRHGVRAMKKPTPEAKPGHQKFRPQRKVKWRSLKCAGSFNSVLRRLQMKLLASGKAPQRCSLEKSGCPSAFSLLLALQECQCADRVPCEVQVSACRKKRCREKHAL
ncbi:hypothetical protein TREES_T100015848 [Tupaia chinensis]|uniref:Uncharacterized protein n=1 Tax=Tupaia chinensis TaxID=246437 RepID=L9L2N5_TUPCH|nr:hypothetical protein TREES_T100015848 [Tupaia chinensis]